MPEISEKILKQMNTTKRDIELLSNFGGFMSGTKLAENPEILFSRLDFGVTSVW